MIFGPIPSAPPALSLTLLLKATEFLSLICLRIWLFPIDLRLSSFQDFVNKAISELHMNVVPRSTKNTNGETEN